MRTWAAEMVVAAVVLFAVAAVSSDYTDVRQAVGNWVAAVAVLGSFAHMQVADRMGERQDPTSPGFVHCNAWLDRYLVGKEIAWCAAFLLLGAWSALVGNALFLLYPAWRRWYRARRPVGRPLTDGGR